jgi:IstB-like ATP binding protein
MTPKRTTGPTSSSSPGYSTRKRSTPVNRRLAARLRYARFPFRKTIEDFDFEFQPSIDRKLVEDLATLRFIEENRPILFLGQTRMWQDASRRRARHPRRRGRLAWLLHHRRRHDHQPRRRTVDGSWTNKLRTYTAPTVLVLDDVGLLRMSDRDAASAFFQVVKPATRKAIRPSSAPTAACPTGARSSATPSSPPPSWTA